MSFVRRRSPVPSDPITAMSYSYVGWPVHFEKAINVPSGDQAGAAPESGLLARGLWSVPSEFMT
jgi:hypothetical protein